MRWFRTESGLVARQLGNEDFQVPKTEFVGMLDMSQASPVSSYVQNYNSSQTDRMVPLNASTGSFGVFGDVEKGGVYRLDHDIVFYYCANFTSNRGLVWIEINGSETIYLGESWPNGWADSSKVAPIPIPSITFIPSTSGPCDFKYLNDTNGANEIWIRERHTAYLYRIG